MNSYSAREHSLSCFGHGSEYIKRVHASYIVKYNVILIL